MRKTTTLSLAMSLFVGSLVFTQSCKKEDIKVDPASASTPDSSSSTIQRTSGEVKVSAFNGKGSHNMGQNCMNCHKSGGSGEGIFIAAGTVYDSLQTSIRSGGIVKLYTGANGTGTLRATLQVDGNGNFYTTSYIDYTGGLYPSVVGSNGDVHYMPFSISMGQCNSCHGVSTKKIWVN